MKAAILQDTRKLVCDDVATPAPGPNEVLVHVAYCGVCGSDVPRYLEGKVHSFPLILGHEFSGTVEKVGPDVDNSLEGKRVAGIPLVPCMECDDCRAGNYSLCSNYSFIGSRQPGAYAEYVAVPQSNVFPISDKVSFIEGAFFEPATVAQHGIDLVHPVAGAEAAVLGCGTIGIFAAQILQAKGLRVTAFARSKHRFEAALDAGVEHFADTSIEGWQNKVTASLSNKGFDYIFDTSGNNTLMVQGFAIAANKATVCMIGTPKQPMEFSVQDWENLNRKELTVTGSWMSYSSPFPGDEWQEVSEHFASDNLRVVDSMIDTVYSLEEISQGLERFSSPGAVSGKLLVKCS